MEMEVFGDASSCQQSKVHLLPTPLMVHLIPLTSILTQTTPINQSRPLHRKTTDCMNRKHCLKKIKLTTFSNWLFMAWDVHPL